MLKLKRIQIQGFKSFVDKMEMVFEGSGITGIVGPNGCGKSNVSDAIAWVLGEQSAKSLRGGRMEDVIFNGTRARLPLGLAEVTLTLVDPEVLKEANASFVQEPQMAESSNGDSDTLDSFENDEAPSEPDALAETAEVPGAAVVVAPAAAAARRKRRPKFQPKPGELVVSRRLFRSGESEYVLNGRQVRLRDIHDIFLGTGLGPDSYAIIEQGRVGLILSSKPSDRRSIIEEAAGITKFKSKRKLAESKLEQARQNLLRVNDITEEVAKQLGSLKRQAAKAKRYRELRERMRELSRNLFNARAVVLDRMLGQSNQQLEEVTERYRQKHRCIEEQELRYRETNASIFSLESALKQMREQLSQLTLEAERGQQRIHYQKEQLRELEARSVENSREIEQLVQQEAQLLTDADQKRQSLAAADEQFERIQQEFLSQNANYQAIQAEVQALEGSNDQQRAELLECVSQEAALKSQLQQLDDLEVRLENQLKRLYQERDETAILRLRLGEEQETSERQQQDEAHQLAERKQQITDLTAALSDLKSEAASNRETLTESKDQFSSATHRLKSLEELAAHHAYSTEAVRLLLSASQEDSPSRFQTPGILADWVEVEGPYETIVEEFLRHELEFLLVEENANAQTGISLLRDRSAGRSTFLLFGGDRIGNGEGPRVAGEAALSEDPSLVPLKQVIRISKDYASAVEEALPQLAAAFVALSYDRAVQLGRQFPQLVFLSPDGDVVRGRLISGGGKAAVGHLTLKREIRELQRKAGVLERNILTQQEKQDVLEHAINGQEQSLLEVRQNAQELEKNLFAADLRLKQILNELDKLGQRQNLAALELQRTESEKAQVLSRRAECAEKIAAGQRRKLEIEDLIASQSDSLKQLKERSAQEAQSLSELRSELATFRERKLAAETDLARLDASLKESQQRRERLDAQKASWAAQGGEIQASIRQLEEALFHQAVQKASLEAEIRSRENGLEELRSLQTSLDQDLQALRTGLEEVQAEKTRLEVERARLSSDFAHLEETCAKELGASLEEIHPETPLVLEESELVQLNQEYQELKEKIEAMGPVNMMALEEYQECDQRFQFLTTQRQDLLDSIEDTSAAIKEIDQVSREQFWEAFTAINANFQESFKTLFGGGHGEMKLLDEQDELESGIEIIAQPPGKRLQNVLLLSGGEKALTAIALLLAIFKFQPSPFCVLDEVDAPLDEINTGRYVEMIKSMSRGTQFLLITHSKRTMEAADTLYGVTMQEAGVSKIVSVQFQ
ncbi:MAG: chromosome segregation protein SMC [Acidobacteria bacterium]|nr:chromosome segregation protein SMC [Acidobacteriota bacterium]